MTLYSIPEIRAHCARLAGTGGLAYVGERRDFDERSIDYVMILLFEVFEAWGEARGGSTPTQEPKIHEKSETDFGTGSGNIASLSFEPADLRILDAALRIATEEVEQYIKSGDADRDFTSELELAEYKLLPDQWLELRRRILQHQGGQV